MQWASQACKHDQTEAQQAAASAGGAHGCQQMSLWARAPGHSGARASAHYLVQLPECGMSLYLQSNDTGGGLIRRGTNRCGEKSSAGGD